MTEDRAAWLQERRKGIGGSDIAAILGLSRYATPYQVWLDKTGQTEIEDEQSEPAYWGTVLEDVVAKEYSKRSGNKVQRVNRSLVHPKAKFARANIDRAVINPAIAGNVRWKDDRLTTDRLLECKTANGFMAKLWGEEGSDEVPEYYLTQCQWYMAITQTDVCDLAVLIGGQSFRSYTIARHDALIDDMIEVGAEFWKLVQTRTPPDPSTYEEAAHKWSQHTAGKTEIVGVEVANAVEAMRRLKAEAKSIAEEEAQHKLTIAKALGDAEIATHGGEKLCTWKTQTANRFDSKAFKEAHPDLHDLFTKESTSRVLRLAPKKD